MFCSLLFFALHRLAGVALTMHPRRLKRYYSDDANTMVSVKVCVGSYHIPTERHYDGENDITMFDLSYDQGLAVIKKAIGYGPKTPLPEKSVVSEIRDIIKSGRGRRKEGLWKGVTGLLMEVEVRGRKIQVMNDCSRLKIKSDCPEHTVLGWFVDEIKKDFKAAPFAAWPTTPRPKGSPRPGSADTASLSETQTSDMCTSPTGVSGATSASSTSGPSGLQDSAATDELPQQEHRDRIRSRSCSNDEAGEEDTEHSTDDEEREVTSQEETLFMCVCGPGPRGVAAAGGGGQRGGNRREW